MSKSPFTITGRIVTQVAEITEALTLYIEKEESVRRNSDQPLISAVCRI